MNVMFDIDGVLADNGLRLRHLTPHNGKKNWNAYYADLPKDILIEPLAEVARGLVEMGHKIYLVTGRPEQHRAATLLWLDKHGVHYHYLLMRHPEDFSPNPNLKANIIMNLPVYIELAFEDDPRSVEAIKPYVGYVAQIRSRNERGVDP